MNNTIDTTANENGFNVCDLAKEKRTGIQISPSLFPFHMKDSSKHVHATELNKGTYYATQVFAKLCTKTKSLA